MGKTVASRFENIAVEQSKLLGVIVDDDQLTLDMDFCLEPGHPDYEAPGADDDCCFHPGQIRFGGISTLNLTRAEGEAGQRRFAIQSFSVEGTKFAMTCDWGAIELQARSIRVTTE